VAPRITRSLADREVCGYNIVTSRGKRALKGEAQGMYATIRQYRVDPNLSEELIQLVEEKLAPRIEELPGFVAYYLVNTGDGTLASMCIFEDRARMEEANRVAREWVKENLETLLAFSPKDIDAAFTTAEGTLRGGTSEFSDGWGNQNLEGASPAQVSEGSQISHGLPRLLSVEEVCEVLGMGTSWVYRWMRSGESPTVRLGRALKVRLADLEEYLENQLWRPSGEE
jgi:excisionase family DNA binding protein